VSKVKRGGAGLNWKKGACHCGAVHFEVLLPAEVEVQSCNCSICRMTGYQHLIVPKSRFRLTGGAEALTTYVFNTGTARHLFCGVCGIKSFYVPRSHPDGYSVNFRCLDSEDFRSVLTTDFDGRTWERHIDELAPLDSET
jgi:hypothetical protein